MMPTIKTLLPLVALAAVALVPVAGASVRASAQGGAADPRVPAMPEPRAVAAALDQVRSGGEGFHLAVHCAAAGGVRNLELFPSGVGVWNRDTQVTLDPETRDALLALLQERDFAAMDAAYGGKPAAEGGGPAPSAAGSGSPSGSPSGPLKVRCQVTFEAAGVAKTSIQQVEGEQSEALMGLATALLDRVEPVAERAGVGARDLADGLAKVAAGTLAPEVFSLRFVRLPGPGDGATGLAGQSPGTIVLVEEGTVVRRAYAPGRDLGEPEHHPLSGGELAALARLLHGARVSSMPPNLWSTDQVELEVRVLDHGKAVLARSFQGRSAQDAPEAQERFEALLVELEGLLPAGAAPAGEDGAGKDGAGEDAAAEAATAEDATADDEAGATAPRADDLQDALARVAAGTLPPEAFALRFLRLPGRGGSGGGVLLHVDAGVLTLRPYSPDGAVGEPWIRNLEPERLTGLVRAIHEARLPELPEDLWATDQVEMDVRVLDHQLSVVARAFPGMQMTELAEGQERFEKLVHYVRTQLVSAPPGEGAPGSAADDV